MYWAVNVDIVKSRSVKRRDELQMKIKYILRELNEKKDSLVVPWDITLGDEIQALYQSPECLPEVIRTIQMHLSPVRIRCGVGYGSIGTMIEDRTTKMDGPVFHAARNAMLQAKKQRMAVFVMVERNEDRDLSIIWDVGLKIIQKWTDRQIEVVFAYEKYKSQKRVADSLNVSQAIVSKHLQKAMYQEVLRIEELVRRTLLSMKHSL